MRARKAPGSPSTPARATLRLPVIKNAPTELVRPLKGIVVNVAPGFQPSGPSPKNAIRSMGFRLLIAHRRVTRLPWGPTP